MNKNRIAVFGAGTMGSGIAVSLAAAGYEVLLYDKFFNNQELNARVETSIWRHLLTIRNASRNSVNNRIKLLDSESSGDRLKIIECDCVIEAIFESLDAKQKLYKILSRIQSRHDMDLMPIYSNTSTIQCGTLSKGILNPERIMGMHFFSPVPQSKMVELIPHRETNDHTIALAEEIISRIGKKAMFAPDVPAFVVNRVLLPMLQELGNQLDRCDKFLKETDEAFRNGTWSSHPGCVRIVQAMISNAEGLLNINANEDREPPEIEALALSTGSVLDQSTYFIHPKATLTPEKIDEMVVLGTGFPAGPFELKRDLNEGTATKYKFRMGPGQLADFVGIDIAWHCLDMLKQQEPEIWNVPALFAGMLNSGRYGLKSGQGFYNHEIVVTKKPESKIIEISIESPSLSHSTIKQLTRALVSVHGYQNIDSWRVFLHLDKVRGADICEFPSTFNNKEYLKKVLSDWHKLMDLIHNFPCPVIATITRLAVGGGYELALACYYIIANKNAKVGLPEIRLGILPGGGGTQNLPRRVGLAKAIWMILGGHTVTAGAPWVDMVVDTNPHELINCRGLTDIQKRERKPLRFTGQEWVGASDSVANSRDDWNGDEPDSFNLALDAICQGPQKDIILGMRENEFEAILKAFETKHAREGILHFLETGKHKFQPQN